MSYSSPTKSHSALLRLTWRNLNNSNLLLIEADKLQTRNIFENIFFRCYVFAQNLQKLKRFCVILVVMNPYTKKQDIWGIFYLPAFLYLWKVGWDPTILSVRHFRESLILTAIYYHSFISFFSPSFFTEKTSDAYIVAYKSPKWRFSSTKSTIHSHSFTRHHLFS